MVRARDLMSPHPTTVDPKLRLAELESLLIEREISGVPVVSEDRLVGVVSLSDIVAAISDETERAEQVVDAYYKEREPDSEGVWARRLVLRESDIVARRLAELTVQDVMTRRLIRVGPDESAEEVARQMLSYRIHRILVAEGERLLGIVSSLDLVQLVAEPRHVRAAPEESGEELVCFTPDLEGEPSELLPGDARVATLRADPASGATTLLVRLPPGGRIEAHSHPGSVQHFVLSGQYESGDQSFKAGTYRRLPAGEVEPLASRRGAVLLVVCD